MFEVNRIINHLTYHVGTTVETVYASKPATRQDMYHATFYLSDDRVFEISAFTKRALIRDAQAILALQSHDVELTWF